MNSKISAATKRNWSKLNSSGKDKLTKRANKRMSEKKFIPVEYLTNKNNAVIIREILEKIEDKKYAVENIIFSLSKYLLNIKHINNSNVSTILNEYPYVYIDEIEKFNWPEDERDLLGVVYQSLLQEGEKNEKGSYYTPPIIVKRMAEKLDFNNGQLLLDPCCGSGSFLMEINAEPNQLFGMDNDPIAVFIAKINMILKYPEFDFYPHIECRNYLEENNLFSLDSEILNTSFDYILTNPPWGAVSNEMINIPEITSKETFSYFFVKSYSQLKCNGQIRFLLPESVTNVKTHKDIRRFILTHCNIESFTIYDNDFTGVTTKYVEICCSNSKINPIIPVIRNKSVTHIDRESFFETENLVFNFLDSKDREILSAVKAYGRYDLSNSIWALGIVTGDNKNKLSNIPTDGTEPIYTGKEICAYSLKESNCFIKYNRQDFQQVAKEEFYRAPEKLVYKFISNKLIFAYDNMQRLFLNSANILIPNIKGMSIKTVMAFLNSELYQYLYIQMFGEIKILKGNLIELPFPELSKKQDRDIANVVTKIINGECSDEIIQAKIYAIFNISDQQIKHIRSVLYGKVA